MSEQLPLIPMPRPLEPCPRYGCRRGCVCDGASARALRERERAQAGGKARVAGTSGDSRSRSAHDPATAEMKL